MKLALSITPVLLAAALLISACSNEKKTDGDDKDTTVVVNKTETTKTDTVTKETPPAASATAALSTQSGPKGMEVDLTRADVNGAILTVEFKFRNTAKKSTNPDKYEYISATIPTEDVNYIDDATAKKYDVLKDQQGRYMASPMQASTSNNVTIQLDYTGAPANVYFRFPAPPAGTKTISVSLPQAGAFNAIPVTFK